MKKLIPSILALIMLSISCNRDDNISTSEIILPEISGLPSATETCSYSNFTIEANNTVKIDCLLDLEGKTINVPEGVTFEFKGGDIFNGTLNFASSGKIAGELLNSELTVEGDITLINKEFTFIPLRWNIVEGEVSQDVAEKNTDILQKAIDDVYSYKAKVFKLGDIDAYFYEDGLSVTNKQRFYTFTWHSNFTLEMTDNTHLRSYVNTDNNAFITLLNIENAHIKGGNLYGYRNTPGYDNTTTQHLILLRTCIDCTVENVKMNFASADGLAINSFLSAFCIDPSLPGCEGRTYVPTENIKVSGCTFDSNRRLNLSIVDGLNITVDDCHFYRAGIDMEYSEGIAPRHSIDIEPVGQGGDMPLQHVDGVVISNCTEEGSIGGIVIASGDNITVTGCTIERNISSTAGSYVKVIDNPYIGGGVSIGQENDAYSYGRSIENIVSGNFIENKMGTGITATNRNVEIFDNKMMNCKSGLLLNNLHDANIYRNTIISTEGSGQGINSSTGGQLKDVFIYDNIIKVDNKPIFIVGANTNNPDHSLNIFEITDNTFEGGAASIFQGVTGCDFKNNTINNYGFGVTSVHNFTIEGNTINSAFFTGIALGGNDTNDLFVVNNKINIINKEAPGHAIKAEGIISSENKNILINENETHTINHWNGIHIEGYNGITVKNNKGTSNSLGVIVYYRGNNAFFENNNQLINGQNTYNINGESNNIVE